MKIKQVAKQLNMTSRNIRFYEEEGLIHVGRSDNNYREDNEEDIKRLKEIKVLRDIGIPIADIKAYFKKELTLKEITTQRLTALENQVKDAKSLYQICEMIHDSEMPLTTFTTEKYQNLLDSYKDQTSQNDYGKLLSEDWRLKLSKKSLIKTFCLCCLPLFFITCILLTFMCTLTNITIFNDHFLFYTLTLIITVCIDILLIINTSIQNHMELRENGIYFYDKHTPIPHFQFLKDVWNDDYIKDLEFIAYEDIVKVKVDTQEAGMITGGDTLFTFYFIVFTSHDELYRFDSTLFSNTDKFLMTLSILHDKSPKWIDRKNIYKLLQLPNEKLYPILNQFAWNKRRLDRIKRINQNK